MADDQGKTEVLMCLSEKGTRPFFYAQTAMVTKAKFLRNLCRFF